MGSSRCCEDMDMIIDNTWVCRSCGTCGSPVFENSIETQEKRAYTRRGHLLDWLRDVQGISGGVPVPDDIIQLVRMACIEPSEIETREILRKKGKTHLFGKIPSIMYRAFGISPRRYTRQEQEDILYAFLLLQAPFRKHRGRRKNFLNYGYVVSKIMEQLGIEPGYLPRLKSKAKIKEHDRIWNRMIKDVGDLRRPGVASVIVLDGTGVFKGGSVDPFPRKEIPDFSLLYRPFKRF